MPFCTNCGSQIAPSSRFCNSCGQQSAGAASASPAIEPLEYSIEGSNLQIARLRLKPGQEVYADAGRMVYKTANVHRTFSVPPLSGFRGVCSQSQHAR